MNSQEIKRLTVQLGTMLADIKESFALTTSAARNIDFFFHTILDFSVLI